MRRSLRLADVDYRKTAMLRYDTDGANLVHFSLVSHPLLFVRSASLSTTPFMSLGDRLISLRI
jgi:hypothetical protein